jgi:hypothetical protein
MQALRHRIVNSLAAFYDQALEWLAAYAGTIARTQCARRDVKGWPGPKRTACKGRSGGAFRVLTSQKPAGKVLHAG